MQRITSASGLALHGVAATRKIEAGAAASLPAHTLMQRAGLAVARLALALAPHARHIWVACGPGNNGGDGFEAAMHLHRAGKRITLTWTSHPQGEAGLPADAKASFARAMACGLPLAESPPEDFDFAIDALLGIGGTLSPDRAGAPVLASWLALLRSGRAPVLAVDVPTGLDASTGADSGASAQMDATKSIAGPARQTGAAARFTLSLLTLKPGLFTAAGRDLAGEVWFDDLGVAMSPEAPVDAHLLGENEVIHPGKSTAVHASHKGSFGDVAVIGGEGTATASMSGAALLAASAALHAGAGRVMVALLGEAAMRADPSQPELMFRSVDALDYRQQVLVCGCGGGEAIRIILPKALSMAPRAVFDADALNAIASDTSLQALLAARNGRGYSTVLTPHPLEAARLLGTTTADIQADRVAAAQTLATKFQCVVVLKGSGSVIAAPGQTPAINPTGNALLATAGTGDVLAGMAGALLAGGHSGWLAACSAVFWHGRLADDWAACYPGKPLTASLLARQAR